MPTITFSDDLAEANVISRGNQRSEKSFDGEIMKAGTGNLESSATQDGTFSTYSSVPNSVCLRLCFLVVFFGSIEDLAEGFC